MSDLCRLRSRMPNNNIMPRPVPVLEKIVDRPPTVANV